MGFWLSRPDQSIWDSNFLIVSKTLDSKVTMTRVGIDMASKLVIERGCFEHCRTRLELVADAGLRAFWVQLLPTKNSVIRS